MLAEHQREVDELQPQIDTAIDKGVAWLLEQQQRDGSWSFEEQVFTTGQTSLSAYTLLKCRVPPEHASLQRAIANIKSVRPAFVYSAGCQVLALTATHDPSHHAHVQQILDDLENWQDDSWSYPNRNGAITRLHTSRDLSITQFALLAYRAATAAGLEPSTKSVKRAFEGTLRYQERGEVAGFSYRFDNASKPTGSMTTAGIATLTMALQLLGKKANASMKRTHAKSTEKALAWLDQNWSAKSNPNRGNHWVYYYLYGVERVGGLLGTEYIGNHPWYLEGAKWLLDQQADDGHWHEHNAQADTCFALLFLARATAPTTGKQTRKPDVLGSESSDDVEMSVRVTPDGRTIEMWLTGVRGTRAGDRPASWPHVQRVDYLIDDSVVATVDVDGPWTAQPCYARHTFDSNKAWTVRARVHVTDEEAAETGSVRALESKPIALDVRYALEPWMLPTATAKNLFAERGAVATASSTHKAFAPALAIDGRHSTGWMYDSSDRNERTLTIRSRKSIRANRLRLSQTHGLAHRRGIHDRIVRVSIELDRRDAIEVALAPDETIPTLVEFDEALRVKRVVIKVLEVVAGGTYPGLGGFAEVSLESD